MQDADLSSPYEVLRKKVHNREPSSGVSVLAVRCLTVAGTERNTGCLIKWEKVCNNVRSSIISWKEVQSSFCLLCYSLRAETHTFCLCTGPFTRFIKLMDQD